MSKTGIWATVIVIVVVVGGIWWWMAANSSPSNSNSLSAAGNTAATSSSSSASSTASSSLPQGDSDQSINEEMTDINTQMNGLSSDTANVNSSMNDQPVQQAE